MRCPTLLALLAGVVLYLVMGALVFRNLESTEESDAYDELLVTKRTFLANHSCVNEQGLNELIKRLVLGMDAGLDVGSANFTSRWDLSSAFFFCGTIITTIGFGNLSPHTWRGQLFCVCYALVGIPMFGILLAGVGDHMGTMLRRAVAKIETVFLKRRVSPTIIRVISAVLSILFGCVIFLTVPTLVFQEAEDWSFLEALYFVVIALTTVGFGDYVPGRHKADDLLFKPLVWLWIVFGLAYFASILTMIANWLKVLSKKTRAEMEELRAHAIDWTQNLQNMSMDFRLPNPLEFNDPFLLQRRRWKRSERRRMRRGAQVNMAYRVRGGSVNGHLPNRWAGLSGSMTRLEALTPGERALAAIAAARSRVRGSGVALRTGLGSTVDPLVVAMRSDASAFARSVFGRSLSLPAAASESALDSPDGVAEEGAFLSGSESPFDYGSDSSASSSSSSGIHTYQLQLQKLGDLEQALQSSTEPPGTPGPLEDPETKRQMQAHETPAEGAGSAHQRTPSPLPPRQPSAPPSPLCLPSPYPSPSPSPSPSPLPPSPPPAPPSLASCQLLDFFGENLAYIDESSDNLSDRLPPAEGEECGERMRRPCKPKRSLRRELPHARSPLQARRRVDSDMRPPSNPPTPPPCSPD